jgi:HEAT repeat protein
MPLLKDKDADTRTGAAAAMGKVGSRTPVPDLIAMMRTDSAKNRRIAIVAIAMIADVSGEAPLREALANVRDDSEGRIQAALGLGRIATPTATAALTRALTDYDLRVVAAAVTGLATSGVAAIPSLSASAKSPNALVRLHSVEALGKIVDSAANPSLIGALNDTDARVRLAAAASLGFAGNSGGVAPLVAKLGGPDAALSTAAADALAQIGAVAQPALVQALGGTDQAAYFAAQALSRMGAPAVRAVERAANAGGTAARWSAVALGGIGSPEAVVVLRRLVASPNAEVSTAATASLQRLGLM